MPKNNDRSTTLSHTSNDGRNQINLTTYMIVREKKYFIQQSIQMGL